MRASYVCAVFVLCACQTALPGDTSEKSRAPSNAGPSRVANIGPLALRDMPVSLVLARVATALDKPLVVDPKASERVACERTTLIVPKPVDSSQVFGLFQSALRTSGIDARLAPGGVIISLDVRIPPSERCQAPNAGTQPAGTPLAPLTASAEPPVDERHILDVIRGGVQRRSATEYEIHPKAVDAIFSSQALLMRSARIVPVSEGGVVRGIKIFGVRKGSLLDLLGFQNADILLTLNGRSLSSPEGALDAYAQVGKEKIAVVTFERAGKAEKITYRAPRP